MWWCVCAERRAACALGRRRVQHSTKLALQKLTVGDDRHFVNLGSRLSRQESVGAVRLCEASTKWAGEFGTLWRAAGVDIQSAVGKVDGACRKTRTVLLAVQCQRDRLVDVAKLEGGCGCGAPCAGVGPLSVASSRSLHVGSVAHFGLDQELRRLRLIKLRCGQFKLVPGS